MSLDKLYRVRCDNCNKYCIPFDEYTPFGCADPESPEPYDPSHYCKKCAERFYISYLGKFKAGSRDGDWSKSNAEMKAAQECGLEWVDSNGLIDTRTNLDVHYRYIKTAERQFYAPYLEYLKDPEHRKLHEEAKNESYKRLPSLV